MDYLSDTTFLIDLWRECGGQARLAPPSDGKLAGPASRFASGHMEAVVVVPWIAKAEFLRGAFIAKQGQAGEVFLASFQTVWPNEATLRRYAEIFSDLRSANQMIGPHDLWIAAAALELNLPLLTRNVDEFKRVADLKVVDYQRY